MKSLKPARNPRVIGVFGVNEANVGPEQSVQEVVALERLICLTTKQQAQTNVQLCTSCRTGPTKIRLGRCRGHDGLGSARQRIAQQKLELPWFIATECEATKILSLDPDRRRACCLAQPGLVLQRCRPIGQCYALERVRQTSRHNQGNRGLTLRSASCMASCTGFRPRTADCNSSTKMSPALAALSNAGNGTRATLSVAASAAA